MDFLKKVRLLLVKAGYFVVSIVPKSNDDMSQILGFYVTTSEV